MANAGDLVPVVVLVDARQGVEARQVGLWLARRSSWLNESSSTVWPYVLPLRAFAAFERSFKL